MRALCAAVSGEGHVYPMIAVGHALAARGHEVVAMFDRRFAGDAASAGLRFVPFPPVVRRSEAFRPYELALDLARAVERDVGRLHADVAVCDVLTLGVALACDRHGVPWATLCVHPLHLASRDLAPFGAGYAPPRTRIGRRRDRRARARQAIDLSRARDDCNSSRVALGLDPLDDPNPQISHELILVPTLPALEPPRSDWPARAHVVGPCLWDPPLGDLPVPGGDAPLVLVATSTAHASGLAEHAAGAIAELGARGVITTGAGPAPAVPDGARIVVAPAAAHDALVRDAAVVVCNGGHGIVARALAAGTPLVIVPLHGDQKENAARAERAGAAVAVRDPRRVGRAIRRVLRDPRFTEAARRIAAAPEASGGPERAAALVEDWAGKQREAGWCAPPSRTEV